MPHLRRIIATLTVSVAALAAPAAASAAAPDQFPVGGPVWNTAQTIAIQHWGQVPCGGDIDIQWTPLEPLTNARSTWKNPTDAWADPTENFDCQIAFNSVAPFDFPMLCTVLTHELGHLLGHPHDPDSGRLMSAIYTDPTPECVAGDPTKAAAPVAQPAATPAPQTSAASRKAAPKKAKAKRKHKVRKRVTSKRAKRSKRCFIRMRKGKHVRLCVVHRAHRKSAHHKGAHRSARLSRRA